MDCKELFLSDIVRVDIVPANSCTINLPFNAPAITSLRNPTIGTPALSVGILEESGVTAVAEQPPTLKDAEQTQQIGYIHTIELNAPAMIGFQALREARKSLLYLDFHIVAHTMDGTRYLCYALPNTAKISLDEQMGSGASITVHATINSLSGFIKILGEGQSSSSD